MKIIQTFWSNPKQVLSTPFDIKAGWLSSEYHWMSWALSSCLLRRHYDEVELYTDALGKEILIDVLQLPYTAVHVVFNEEDSIHSDLFALAKMKTYSLQKTPFLHVDADVFLWNPLPQDLMEQAVIASNLEMDLFFNKEILEETANNFIGTPSHLENVLTQEHIFASNAGIFGGSNIDFIQAYCALGMEFINKNAHKLTTVKTKGLNWLIEQISLFYFAKQQQVPIGYYFSEAVTDPLYEDYWRFADIPHVKLIHPVGGCKKIPYVLYHLSHRLRLEFPEYYYKILRTLKTHKVPLKNRIYEYISLPSRIKNLDLTHHQEELESSLLHIDRPDFEMAFERTLKTLRYQSEIVPSSAQDLKGVIAKENTTHLVTEIYGIETLKHNHFSKLIEHCKEGKIYREELTHYKIAASFFLTADWTKTILIRNRNSVFKEVGWCWNLSGESESHAYEKVIQGEKGEYLFTLNYNIHELKLEETYYEGLDAIILRQLEKEKEVFHILSAVLVYFEDGLSVENPDYQMLIFDTIKRLAFANLISLKPV